MGLNANDFKMGFRNKQRWENGIPPPPPPTSLQDPLHGYLHLAQMPSSDLSNKEQRSYIYKAHISFTT